jgi:ATP-dependent DNA helicase HFM1/MER3
MYAKCSSLTDARRALDQMPKTNPVSWTVMIAAYARNGNCEEALKLYSGMHLMGFLPDHVTFVSVLPACANLAALQHGRQIHEQVIRSGFQFNLFVGSTLVDMYVKCGSLEDARNVFDKMPQRNVITWNAMIAGYAQIGQVEKTLELFWRMPLRSAVSWNVIIAGFAQNGHNKEAFSLFNEMQRTGFQPNQFIFASVLRACASLAELDRGTKIHEEIIRCGFQSDVFVGSALVDMYCKCGNLEDARKVFDKMSERNVVSWTAMIAGYTQNEDTAEALKIFEEMPKRSVVSWNAMIAGIAQNGHFSEALKLFQQMQLSGVKPNLDTFASILPACANLASIEQGKEVHENIIRIGCQSDVFVASALVDMYGKCGSLDDACRAFRNIHRHNVVSWTVMILGYAMHGYADEALQLFEKMQNSGTNPDSVTFIGVLSACCHAGLVDDGWKYFDLMSQYYHITPLMEHYACMVDLLGRAGYLYEAQDFIENMPIKPDATVWGSLLGACKIHANIDLGEFVANRLFELDPADGAPYVLLSNMYAEAGRWDGIINVRKIMKDRQVKKKPGCSWIEINSRVHSFLVGNDSNQ